MGQVREDSVGPEILDADIIDSQRGVFWIIAVIPGDPYVRIAHGGYMFRFVIKVVDREDVRHGVNRDPVVTVLSHFNPERSRLETRVVQVTIPETDVADAVVIGRGLHVAVGVGYGSSNTYRTSIKDAVCLGNRCGQHAPALAIGRWC